MPANTTLRSGVYATTDVPFELRETFSVLTSRLTGSAPYEAYALTTLVGGAPAPSGNSAGSVATHVEADSGSLLLMVASFQAQSFTDPFTLKNYVRARWYDPSTGSFLSPDPMMYEDSSNLYAFAGGDPINGRDPTGERVRQIGWVYVVSGKIKGVNVRYVGSGEQLARVFEPHENSKLTPEEWRQLVNDPETRIEAKKVFGDPDARATNQGTQRAAVNQGLRSKEQPVLNRVMKEVAKENVTLGAKDQVVVLNDRAAAKDPALYGKRHKTFMRGGRWAKVRPRLGGVLAVVDVLGTLLSAHNTVQEQEEAKNVDVPILFGDDGGAFTVGFTTKWLFNLTYYKIYRGGKLEGQQIELTDEEGEMYRKLVEELYGKRKDGVIIPGLLELKQPEGECDLCA
jgi:RHS repeat-associated protein